MCVCACVCFLVCGGCFAKFVCLHVWLKTCHSTVLSILLFALLAEMLSAARSTPVPTAVSVATRPVPTATSVATHLGADSPLSRGNPAAAATGADSHLSRDLQLIVIVDHFHLPPGSGLKSSLCFPVLKWGSARIFFSSGYPSHRMSIWNSIS